MAFYLRTCAHRNRLGLFVLDPLYAAADLKWSVDDVTEALGELLAQGHISWDQPKRTVFVPAILRDDPLSNPNVAAAARRDLDALPDTRLVADLAAHVELVHSESVRGWKDRSAFDGLMATLNRRGNGSATRGGTAVVPPSLPLPTSPRQTSPARPSADGRGDKTADETWEAVKDTVLDQWHRGQETIVVKGKPVGMGAERLSLIELVRDYGHEETIGAIEIGPVEFRFTEPTSLQWYTSPHVGPANFSRAVGAWRKGLDASFLQSLRPHSMPRPIPAG